MLRALIEKVDNMKEPINNIIREMETQRKDKKISVWSLNHCNKKKWKMPLIDLLVDGIYPRKESVSLKIFP